MGMEMDVGAPRMRSVRPRASRFDGRFFEKDALFWPLARAAERFADHDDWPPVTAYVAGGEECPVRFAEATPRPRRARRAGEIDPSSLYDARIVNDRIVPTRARSWHDYLNALVWLTFPRAKWTLHERQHRAIAERLEPGMTRLPPARTREHDALALADEGGVVCLTSADAHESVRVVFGHALYEGMVLGVRSMVARGVVARVASLPATPEARIALADALLAEALSAPSLTPDALPRISLR